MANDISTSFNDREMFVTQPDWGADITSKIQMERRILQQIGGVKTISELITDAPITVNSDFTLSDRESIYSLLQFFDQRKGGTESFWFLHPGRFFTLKEPYTSGSTYIVANRNYGDRWTQSLPSQYDWGIYICMHDGDLICRKVTGVTDDGDTSRIYLEETIPRNITADNHFIIGRTLVGRFDQNQIRINFSTQGIGVAPLRLKETYREYDSWNPVDGVRQWDVAPIRGTWMLWMVDHVPLYTTGYYYGHIVNSWGAYPVGGTYAHQVYISFATMFDYIDIEKGVTIKEATITYLSGGTETYGYRGFNFDWSCANYDAAPSMATSANGWKHYARTTAVNWTVANGAEHWIEGQHITTPNLAPAVQQIIDRPGWPTANRSMMFCGDQQVDVGTVTKSFARPSGGVGQQFQHQPRLKLEWV